VIPLDPTIAPSASVPARRDDMTADEAIAFLRDRRYIGARLCMLRARAVITREDLAKRANISVSGLYYIEHDLRRPRFSTLRTLAEALADLSGQPITVQDLLQGA